MKREASFYLDFALPFWPLRKESEPYISCILHKTRKTKTRENVVNQSYVKF